MNVNHPEWKDYAVDYKGMKKLLPKDEEEESKCDDYKTFWDVFERSENGLDTFYRNQEAWAKLKQKTLQKSIENLSHHSNTDVDEMMEHLKKFRQEVELVREFLLVNQTAFSKILKKYDKRTLSKVRESKLAEILEAHMYLDGHAMEEYLKKIDEMIGHLEELKEQQPKAGEKRTHRRRTYSMELKEKTKKIIKYIEEQSPFFSKHPPKVLPTFEQGEIETAQDLLGQGHFCSVREIRGFHFEDAETTKERLQMQNGCLVDGNQGRYAIKQINEFLSTKEKLEGAVDLAIEAKYLSCLDHPNIISLFATGGSSRYFLIIDRLSDDSLNDKIYKNWKEESKQLKGKGLGRFLVSKETQLARQELWNVRIKALYDIAKGMVYLHERDIIHRDLKPDNIGFDRDGVAKIFDFGLVKELQPKERVGKDEYRASGRTGTRKYMAPENILYKPYGKPVDCYSFAIMAWETLSLETPFDGMGFQKHTNFVTEKNGRPTIRRDWPKAVQQMLKDAWVTKPSDRISAAEIESVLGGLLS